MDTTEAIPRFPLAWPLGWPRAKFSQHANFIEKVETRTGDAVTKRAADWRKVLGFDAAQTVSVEQMDAAFKAMARTKHPDAGGTDEGMMHLNRAREYALSELLA